MPYKRERERERELVVECGNGHVSPMGHLKEAHIGLCCLMCRWCWHHYKHFEWSGDNVETLHHRPYFASYTNPSLLPPSSSVGLEFSIPKQAYSYWFNLYSWTILDYFLKLILIFAQFNQIMNIHYGNWMKELLRNQK